MFGPVTESWRARTAREARELHACVQAALAKSIDAVALRTELEAIAQSRLFSRFTWLWGPVLYERDRIRFRPFVLAHFSAAALDERGQPLRVWTGPHGAAMERWFAIADDAHDVEIARRLYHWRLEAQPVKARATVWRTDLLMQLRLATSPALRDLALAKRSSWMSLDGTTAFALYQLDAAAARGFITSHLPSRWWNFEDKRSAWVPLLEHTRELDPDLHFRLYRRLVDPRQWAIEVQKLAASGLAAEPLDAELERRHPEVPPENGAETFLALARARGRDVLPYLQRHVTAVMPQWRLARRESRGLPELLALAESHDWLELWALLLRVSATTVLFDRTVRDLVSTTKLGVADARRRLEQIAGPGRELSVPGLGIAAVHALEEDTVLALYRKYPDLVRGRFRLHLLRVYPRVIAATIAADDTDLLDFFASRMAMEQGSYHRTKPWGEAVATLAAHYEALPDAAFVSRAASALTAMPAYAIWSYDGLLRQNALARLLFERSTQLYLSDPRAVRDLLESPQIHVQLLALRALASDDPRAPALGAMVQELLQATLFRPLHRRTRLVAFRALGMAARHDEATARYLLGRMRDALALPERRYPMEALVGLIATVLARWPALRSATERPRVFGLPDEIHP